MVAAAPVGGETRLLNFVVVGEVRSGTTLVQTSLCNRDGAVCHGDLFHADPVARRVAHEAYFGPSRNPSRLPEWFTGDDVSPWQYVNHTVLDHPLHDESAVGFRVLYSVVKRWELWDLLGTRCQEGDFCVVHVTRNPAACLVSLRQAEQSGVWTRPVGGRRQTCRPNPVSLDATELTAWCRAHAAVAGKIRAACTDCLEVRYLDLFRNYQPVMRGIFDFLELTDSEVPPVPGTCRLRNRSMVDRIVNLDRLRREVPSDVRALLDAEDLF